MRDFPNGKDGCLRRRISAFGGSRLRKRRNGKYRYNRSLPNYGANEGMESVDLFQLWPQTVHEEVVPSALYFGPELRWLCARHQAGVPIFSWLSPKPPRLMPFHYFLHDVRSQQSHVKHPADVGRIDVFDMN